MAQPSLSLPVPSAAEQALSEQLLQRLLHAIRKDGPMPFDRYMARVLYEPELGYYTGPRVQFGSDGDFITSPEQGRLFAQALAVQINALSTQFEGPWTLLEPGAGSGALAANLLPALDPLPDQYWILEPSPFLRAAQQQRLAALPEALQQRVHWIGAPPDQPWQGLMVANEVLDALPVKRFEITEAGLMELAVGECDGQLRWQTVPPHPALLSAIAPMALPTGYVSECSLAAGPWLAQMVAKLHRGAALLVDYGYPRQAYYHAERSQGTVVCHYRHRAHFDPLLWPGITDVSAFVEFTSVAEAGAAQGLEVLAFTNQAALMVASGLHHRLHEAADLRQQMADLAEYKRLMLPTEMGEKFKLLVLARGLVDTLQGLSEWCLRDRL